MNSFLVVLVGVLAVVAAEPPVVTGVYFVAPPPPPPSAPRADLEKVCAKTQFQFFKTSSTSAGQYIGKFEDFSKLRITVQNL